jgi:Na+:H+ antiporter, NhaA family
VFVVAFAVIDDLGAIIIIAAFYTAQLSIGYFVGALGVWVALIVFNRLRVMSLIPYLLGGLLMWFLMLKSGVHATLAGVMLAFAIPFTAQDEDEASPSHMLEHSLHKPVAFIIMPIFALANTGIILGGGWMDNIISMNSLGIIGGLLVGKSLGIVILCFVAVASGICHLPADLHWRHIFGAGLLGGIGFTMSIFITNLAFVGNAEAINASKTAILAASFIAGVVGFLWLQSFGKPTAADGRHAAERIDADQAKE